jgi:copper homeostasis protein
VGGVTPSFGLVAEIRRQIPSMPVVVLIRPRSGDFFYSESEYEIMKCDIKQFGSLGVHGVAIGALTRDYKVPITLYFSTSSYFSLKD